MISLVFLLVLQTFVTPLSNVAFGETLDASPITSEVITSEEAVTDENSTTTEQTSIEETITESTEETVDLEENTSIIPSAEEQSLLEQGLNTDTEQVVATDDSLLLQNIVSPLAVTSSSLVDLEIEVEGTPIGNVTGSIPQDARIELDVTFALNLTAPQNGDFFTYQLPPSIANWNTIAGARPAKDGDPGYTWSVTNNLLTVTFTDIDAAAHNGQSQLSINMVTGFNLSNTNGSLNQTVVVPSLTQNSESFPLTFLPSTYNDKQIKKTPVNATARVVGNERYFDWEVWVNTAGKPLTNATIVDTPTGGHEITGSLIIEAYDVGLTGPGANPVSTQTASNLSSITLNGNQAYKIKYTTVITIPGDDREGEKKFHNKVELKQNGTTIAEDTSSEVKTTYGKTISKDYDLVNNYETKWGINFNMNQRSLAQADSYFTDVLTGPQEFDRNSIVVYEVTVNDDGTLDQKGAVVPATAYTVTFGSQDESFRLQFNNGITKAYRIEYVTKFNEDFYVGTGGDIRNIGSSGTKTTGNIGFEGTQGVLVKTRTVDVNTQEITWTIRISADGSKPITNLTLTDSFAPESGRIGTHTLVGGITLDGQPVNYSANPNGPGFIITGINVAVGQTVRIMYKTSYDVDATGKIEDNAKYTNTANAKWTSGPTPYDLTVQESYEPSRVTQNNGVKNGSFNYQTQEFTWQVIVNANRRTLSGSVLDDNIGDGHQFIPDSLQVHEFTRTATDEEDFTGTVGNLLDPSHYTLTVASDNKSYKLTFNNPFDSSLDNKTYRVTYKTKDSDNILGIGSTNPNDGGAIYRNTAKFTTSGGTVFNIPSDPVELHWWVANDLISKGLDDNNSSNTNGILTWTLDVNRSHSDLKNVKVSDKPSQYIFVDRSSFLIRPYVVNTGGVYLGGNWQPLSALGYSVQYDANGGFVIDMGDLKNKGYQIQYKTYTVEGTTAPGALTNDAKITFDGYDLLEENQKTDYQYVDRFQFSYTSSQFSLVKGNLKVLKVGKNVITNTERPLAGASFELYVKGTTVLVRNNLTVDANGELIIENLNYGEYTLKEVVTPTGYVTSPDIDFIFDANTKEIKVTNETAEVTVTKVWEKGDAANRPAITIQLLQDGVVYDTITLTSPATTYTWTGLPITTGTKKHVYSVNELPVTNYNTNVNGFTITNTYQSPVTDITATKVWVNGPSTHPTIEVQLYRTLQGATQAEAVGTPITLTSGNTSYTWTSVPQTDENGVPYSYSVNEVQVPQDYNKTISADGLTITNSYVIPLTTYTAYKEWVNGPAVKPAVQFQLYQDGVAFGSPVTLPSGTTEYTWTDLEKTDINGVAYEYTVDEVAVPANFTKVVAGNKIINTYVSPKTTYTATKVWLNGPANDRPTIELQLYRNGVAYGAPVTLANGETVYTWTGLDLTDENAINYVYTVDEVAVPTNYVKVNSGTVIVNSYVIPKTSYTVTKDWVNGPATHPTIEVQLYRDGVAYGAPVTLENGTTSHTWTDLDATDINGVTHVYTVDEVATPTNYDKTVTGNTITNSYVIPKTDYTATKVWIDGPSTHPTIEFQLYQDGVAFGAPVTIANGTTSYTWTGLDATNINGVPHVYTVDEVAVPANYVKTVNGTTISNEYFSPKTDLTVTKVWQDGPKPAIEVQLYRNGVAFGTPVQLTTTSASYTWSQLDVTNKAGVAYVYTVDEVNTPANYDKSINGLTITNTYVIPKVSYTATKVWVDGPTVKPTIELQLFRNGVAFGTPVSISNGTTSYTWTNLDGTNIDGEVYTYTVDEVAVPANYVKDVKDNTITNTYVSPLTEVTATKVWENAPVVKQTIEIQLYRNGEKLGAPVAFANGTTTYTWTNLLLTDRNGVAYVYTVDEVAVPKYYEKTVNGFTITNKYVPPFEIPDYEEVPLTPQEKENKIEEIEKFLKGYEDLTPLEREEFGRQDEIEALRKYLAELKASMLPQTDASTNSGMTAAGFVLMILASYVLVARRKRMQ